MTYIHGPQYASDCIIKCGYCHHALSGHVGISYNDCHCLICNTRVMNHPFVWPLGLLEKASDIEKLL